MTRFLSSLWTIVALLLLARAYGAQLKWEKILQELGRPHEYQTAALVMASVAAVALLIAASIAVRSRLLTSYALIGATAMLFLYSVLMLGLGMHRYEPAYATVALLVLFAASGATCASALVLRKRGEA